MRSLYFRRVILYSLYLICVVRVDAQSQPTNNKEFTLVTWNIGHFSKGHNDYSQIKDTDYKEKVKKYRKFLYNSLKPDVLCVNEYESEFCQDSILGCAIAEDVLFDKFKIQRILKKNRFICNAIFSNIILKNIRKKNYMYDPAIKNTIKRIDWYYYISSDIIIGGETVKLVCTHLVNRHEEVCQSQISQLIEEFKEFDKVIICGDMNTSDWSKFKDAGYRFANDGSLITFPGRSLSIDNIIVRGLGISDVRVLRTDLSDHYPVLCRIVCQ